ncbi:MAG: hypothetical protein WC371_01405 [Parachlamydiales bacterium]|jgi:hypothetical protein
MVYFLLFFTLLFSSCSVGPGYQRSYMITQTAEEEVLPEENEIETEK